MRSWKVYPETFFDLCWLGVSVLPIRNYLEIASSYITIKIGMNFKKLVLLNYNSDVAQIWFVRSWKVYPETFFDLWWLGVLVLPSRTNLEIVSSYITIKIGINFKNLYLLNYKSDFVQIRFLRSLMIYLETFFDLYRLGVSILKIRTNLEIVSS